jgi:hypothetical protein
MRAIMPATIASKELGSSCILPGCANVKVKLDQAIVEQLIDQSAILVEAKTLSPSGLATMKFSSSLAKST